MSLFTSAAASAATIVYTFENAANEQDINTTTADYTAPDSNDFGSGVTVGNFTITDFRPQADFRTHASSEWAAASAAGTTSGFPTISFTVFIDDTVMVDLTNLAFDYGYLSTATSNTTINWSLSLSQGTPSATSGGGYTHDGGANFQQFGEGNALTLADLSDLTDTSVTFTWALTSSKSNNIGNQGHRLDNITLTGTVTPVPEPSSFALLGLGGLALILRRRK